MKISMVSSRVDLDTDGSVAEVNLVASPVHSSNDGVSHCYLAFGISDDIGPRSTTLRPFSVIPT